MPDTRLNRADWLQLSDLHVFPEADTTSMLRSFKQLALKIDPKFIIVTGDFRHLKFKTKYEQTCEYLSEIVRIFGVNKKDVYLIPGNHDVNLGKNLKRDGAITNTLDNMNYKYSGYMEYLSLFSDAFTEYKDFVSLFYKDAGLDADDMRLKAPEQVFCSVRDNSINLLHVNSALISDGRRDGNGCRMHPEILDINAISETLRSIDKELPTIILAHHGIESLHEEHRKRIKGMMREGLFSAYLHGDIHLHMEEPIRSGNPSEYIPQIACGKSAPQDGDNYSDIGVIYYHWRDDDKVEVEVYKWAPDNGFSRNWDYPYAYNIDEPYTFNMRYEHNNSSGIESERKEIVTLATDSKENGYLTKVVEENRMLKRRDSIDYNAEEWAALYSYPVFSKYRTPILSENPFRTVVISPSGYGKSVLLQGLALLYAQKCINGQQLPEQYESLSQTFLLEKTLFPIIVRAKDYNNSEPKGNDNILNYAGYSVQDYTDDLCKDIDLFSSKCRDSQTILLIDSLDEVYEDRISDFIELIKKYCSDYPDSSIIATSRAIPGLRSLQDCGFVAVGLCKFSEEQIDSQIEKRSIEYAEKIKERIKGHKYLSKMAQSPIMLATMLSEMGRSPSSGNVVEFLGMIIDSIMKQRWRDFDLLNDGDVRALLSGLAWRMLINNNSGVSKNDLRKQIESIYIELEETGYSFNWRTDSEEQPLSERLDQLITGLTRRSGILNLEGNDTQYVFQDKLVKWYLGSVYVKLILSGSQDNRVMPTVEIFCPLDNFLYNIPLGHEIVHTLVMSFSIIQRHQQQALLQYMLLRATCSIDKEETAAINEGFEDLINNTFGTNDILNLRMYSSSWELPAVQRWLYFQRDTKISNKQGKT